MLLEELYSDIGIAIALEGDVLHGALKLAEELQTKAGFTLSIVSASAIPHITLFQGRFPKEAQGQIKKVFDGLPKISMGPLRMSEELLFRSNGNVFWNVLPNDTLRGFHEMLNQKLFPLTRGLVLDQFKTMLEDKKLSPEDRKQILTYGTLLAGDCFLPHITLGRLANPCDANLLANTKVQPFSFFPAHFLMGNLGQYGEVKEVLWES